MLPAAADAMPAMILLMPMLRHAAAADIELRHCRAFDDADTAMPPVPMMPLCRCCRPPMSFSHAFAVMPFLKMPLIATLRLFSTVLMAVISSYFAIISPLIFADADMLTIVSLRCRRLRDAAAADYFAFLMPRFIADAMMPMPLSYFFAATPDARYFSSAAGFRFATPRF